MIAQGVALSRRIAEPEFLPRLSAEAALGQVGAGRSAGGAA